MEKELKKEEKEKIIKDELKRIEKELYLSSLMQRYWTSKSLANPEANKNIQQVISYSAFLKDLGSYFEVVLKELKNDKE